MTKAVQRVRDASPRVAFAMVMGFGAGEEIFMAVVKGQWFRITVSSSPGRWHILSALLALQRRSADTLSGSCTGLPK